MRLCFEVKSLAIREIELASVLERFVSVEQGLMKEG